LGDFFGDEDVAHNFLVKIMKKCDEWDLVTGILFYTTHLTSKSIGENDLVIT
jgi:hypothetical protein